MLLKRLFLSVLLVGLGTTQAQNLKSLDRQLERLQKKHKVPGMSIAIIKDNAVDYTKAYGHRSDQQKKFLNEESLFLAGTTGQTVVSLAIMKEIQSERLHLYTDVNRYLMGWKIRQSQLTKDNPVTLFQLLSHNAGINIPQFDAHHEEENLPSLEEVLNGEGTALNKKVHPVLPPGTKFSFSSGAYAIIQKMITDLTGQSFHEYMSTQLLTSLNMKHSYFTQPLKANKTLFKNAVYGHTDKGVFFGKRPLYTVSAASGLWTTPSDLSKVLIATNLSLQDNEGVLKQDMAAQFTESVSATGLENISYSLGYYIYEQGESQYYGAHGSADGFSSIMLIHPEKNYGAVILLNKESERELIANDLRWELIKVIAEHFDWDF